MTNSFNNLSDGVLGPNVLMKFSMIFKFFPILVFPLFFLVVGCLGFKSQEVSSINKSPILKNINSPISNTVEKGRIFDVDSLKGGSKLLITPFKAGEGIEATEALDRIAYLIIRGIYDSLNEQGSNIEVLSNENNQEADFILDGYIIHISKSSGIDKWVLRDTTKELRVKGKMIDKKTAKTILIFTDVQNTKDANNDYKQLGYTIGKNIGNFIYAGEQQ